MTTPLQFWLALILVLAATGCLVVTAVHFARRKTWAWQFGLPGVVLLGFGLGAFDAFAWNADAATWWIAPGFIIAAFVAFVAMLIVVIVNGMWSAPLGYGATGVLCFGLGTLLGPLLADGLHEAGVFLCSIRVQEPWWLLLLGLIPLLFWTSYGNLISLGSTRRWIVLALRCSLIGFLALALAEVFARKPNDNVTVMFLWDRSLSMPPEIEAGVDQREKRTFDFINQSVKLRGSKHANDRIGVIVFGKQPRLELPPSAVGEKLGFKKVHSEIDNTYTDIAGAIKLALASFPEGSGKRIVLISDGNENIGRAEEQARIAKQNGVQVDIVPVDAKRSQINEILVERIEAPPVTEKDSRLPIRVVIQSFHPKIVVAQLTLRKITFGQSFDPKQDDKKNTITVKLHQGLNPFYFQQPGSKDDTVFAYEATVTPLRVETPEGALIHKGLPGDRVDNNSARATVMTRGQRAILVLEDQVGKHQLLVDRLRAAKSSLRVVTMDPDQLRNITKGDNERLATFLTRFDAVIFANIPADSIGEDEQKVFRSHIHDQGAGFIMIGGNQSFGAGGWQNTEIEKALPVNMELKSMKIEGKSGLVLIMHASEISEGNAWQRKIAKLAFQKLNATDMFGQIHYDYGINGGMQGHKWHIPFQEIEENRKNLAKLIDSMQPGDMPDVDPAFSLAHKELTNAEYQLGTKHIILISDGDHWDASVGMLNRLRAAKITCTTVCITSHGQNEVQKMAAVARYCGGRDYYIKDPKELPAIYIKESRLVSQAFVHEKAFVPVKGLDREGPIESLPKELPSLYGFCRTTLKDSSLVKQLIETPKIGQYKFPILASWQYGLGKSIAFTSDARTLAQGSVFWDKDWASADLYGRFWEQTVDWVLRPTETGKHLFLTTEHKDGKIRIIVEAQDADKAPLTDVQLKAGITSPAFKVKDDRKTELKFEQKNAGVFEADIPADEVGAHFIYIQAKWKQDGKEMSDTVRAGVTIPYSPEFAEMESNPALLQTIANMTGGKEYADNAAALEAVARSTELFRPVPESFSNLQALWPWMVFLSALCLLLDVAVRRIAIDPEVVWTKSAALWLKLRGRAPAPTKMAEYIERLKSRKAQVSESMDKQKAAKKFGIDRAGEAD